MNLAAYACGATPSGGARLGITTARVSRPALRTGATGDPILFAVSEEADTGCGMDAETKSHLFEPFFTTMATGR